MVLRSYCGPLARSGTGVVQQSSSQPVKSVSKHRPSNQPSSGHPSATKTFNLNQQTGKIGQLIGLQISDFVG